MSTPLFAGFECAQFPHHDLLTSTRHTPETDMQAHYAQAARCGAVGARDGLVPGHDPAARLRAAQGFQGRVIWDLSHYRLPDLPHLALALGALPDGAWVLPVNEPSVESLWGLPTDDVVRAGALMGGLVRFTDPAAKIVTCDPFHTLHPAEFYATDALVKALDVDLVGLNFYPHHAAVPLSRALREVHARYGGRPIAITETSWHEGHPGNADHGWPEHWTRADWWAHVQSEVAASGVPVEFVTWYPWTDCPPWEDPTGTPWPHGWPEGLVA